MGNFFKTFWAAFLAFIAANIVWSILGLIIFFAVIASIGASGGGSKVVVKDGSILHIGMDIAISDSPVSSSPFATIDLSQMRSTRSWSIMQVLTAIDAAASDSRIEGIYLDFDATGGMIDNAMLVDLHDAIIRFKESGKWVVSYGSGYSEGGYYLASTADSLFMNPEGGMIWTGLSAQVMFYKGLLDKLGVEPIILRHGTFKAAVEPFMLDRMSPENREQMETLVGSLWGSLVCDIAKSRGIDSVLLQQYASELTIDSPAKAVELGLVDRLVYIDELKATLNDYLGDDADDDPEMISLSKYITAVEATDSKHFSKNEIEVIYFDGTIVDGSSNRPGMVAGLSMAEKLADAREDDDVKAVVLRINSPGGSALASEVMWREIELLKAEKPVVVSMGSMAASGGYYIAAPSDVILANRATLTGSIGVFGLLFNGQKALKDKLGITVDVARTNPSADIGSPYRAMTDPERAYMMRSVEDVYATFVGHVADGRNMTPEAVDAIGQGRIWSGKDAKRIGLVDGFGTILDAIALAADRAGVADDYRVSESISSTDPFTALMQSFSEARSARMRAELGEAYGQYIEMRDIFSKTGVQARMLYDVRVK